MVLPQPYPNYKTVHRRFQQWCRQDVLRGVLTNLAYTLREQGRIDEEECFVDAMFSSAKGGGAEIGPRKRGKGVKIMGIVDRHGLPLAISTYFWPCWQVAWAWRRSLLLLGKLQVIVSAR